MANWTGHIRKDGDGIAGSITDSMGYQIDFTGTRAPGGYALTGTTGAVPEWLALVGDDLPEVEG